MVHIGIAWANPYSRNLGVAALAYSSLALLYDVCRENNIEADFTLIGSSGPARDAIIINGNEIRFGNVRGNDHQKFKSLLRMAILPRKYMTGSILKLDIVFDISEGDSFTDIYGDKRYEKMLNSKRFFNILRVPQVLLPQTIGPFNSPENEKRAFNVMKKLKMVISRDKQSVEYAAKFLPNEKVLETIDVAFYMGYQKHKFNPRQVHVGLNISGLLWNGGYTRENQFNLKCNYRELIESIVEYFTRSPNVRLHIIPHVISNRRWVEDDYTIAEDLHEKYPDTIVAPLFKTPVEAKEYISGFDFFIGSRMHACIAAFSAGVPVFPMAYSRKFNGLFTETLDYKWMGDCLSESTQVISRHLIDAFKDRIHIKNEIENINRNVVAARIDRLKEQLKEVLTWKNGC